jgi:hypothetical protein
MPHSIEEPTMIYDKQTMKTVQFDVKDRNASEFVAVLIYEGKRVISAYAGLMKAEVA